MPCGIRRACRLALHQGGAIVVVGVLTAVAPTFAKELPQPSVSPEGAAAVRPWSVQGRVNQHLLRRVSTQLESLSAFQSADWSGRELTDHPLFGWLHRDVERGLEKTTRRALGQLLLEVTNLDRVANDTAARLTLGSADSPHGTHLDFGFHSGMPRVGLTHGVGRGTMRYAVSLDGNLGLTYSNARMGRFRIHAGVDSHERYALSGRFGF